MTEKINELKRLAQLKADGVLTDAEFETEKAKLPGNGPLAAGAGSDDTPLPLRERWRVAQDRSKKVRHFFRWFFGLQAISAVGIGIYFFLTLQTGQVSEPRATQELVAAVDQMDAAADELNASLGEKPPVVGQPASPPADYMQLCVFATGLPLGWTLKEFSDVVTGGGATFAWESNGQDWIMRVKRHDSLNGANHEVAFEFGKVLTSHQRLACSKGGQDVGITRGSFDGEILSGLPLAEVVAQMFGSKMIEHEAQLSAIENSHTSKADETQPEEDYE